LDNQLDLVITDGKNHYNVDYLANGAKLTNAIQEEKKTE
jgi:hypothetical protein